MILRDTGTGAGTFNPAVVAVVVSLVVVVSLAVVVLAVVVSLAEVVSLAVVVLAVVVSLAVVAVVALGLAHLTPHFLAFCKLAISYFLKRVFATSKSAPLLASRDRGCPQSKPQISAASEGGNSSNLRPNVHVAADLGT